MRTLLFLLIIHILFIVNPSNGQVIGREKAIKGDTTFWKKYVDVLGGKLQLNNLRTSTDDFNFRLSDQGTVIDIKRKGNVISGEIIHYRFWQNRRYKVKDTLFKREDISTIKSQELYHYLHNSGIKELPTDKEIKGWSQGFDGETFIVELADKEQYAFKTYWTPSAQDSLKEALIIQNLVDKIHQTLDIKVSTGKFISSLPRKGCYTSGGMTVMCYISSNFDAGYLGSGKFPLGYRLAYNAPYIGKKRTGAYIDIQHQFNENNESDLSISAAKGSILTKKENDFLYFNYRKREWDVKATAEPDENYKFFYAKVFNKISLGIGVDYLSTNGAKTGGLIYASKWFNKPRIRIVNFSSIFKDQIDYKTEVLKSVSFRNRSFVRSLTFGFNYESFRSVGNAGGSVYVSL